MTHQLEQEKDFLFAEAKLGIEVEKFLSSDVGRYIKGRADGELQDIQHKLLTIEGWRDGSAVELQQNAKALQWLMTWLTEAINNGHQAEFNLNELEQSER